MDRKSGFFQRIFCAVIALAILFGSAVSCYQIEQPNESAAEMPAGESIPPAPPECVDHQATDPDLPESCRIWFSFQQAQGGTSPLPSAPEFRGTQTITVKATGAGYKTVTSKPNLGWFHSGQDADIVLSAIDFNNTGGPLLFNHPGAVASDGTHLILADRNNNRVLIWNTLPNDNTPPDFVLGQKNFITNNPGAGPDQMNWPVSVATDGARIIVADTYNDRLLIWNRFPAQHGQPADIVIENDPSRTNPKRSIVWPWAVWTDGEKLVMTSTGASRVLIWNIFPTANNQPADLALAAGGQFGTPRTIGSDGAHLVIGDHNAKLNNGSGNFFWKSFPTREDQPCDFFMANPQPVSAQPGGNQPLPGTVFWGPTFGRDGKFLVLTSALNIWNTFPQDENDGPDLMVGGDPMPGSNIYRFNSGDGSSMAIAGEKLYLALSNGNMIVGFNTFPTHKDQKPDFAVGSLNIDTNTLETNFILSNPVPATDGQSLFISSDFDRKLYVYQSLPDESGAKPDIIYSLPEGPWDNELYGETLALAGHRTVYIWKKLPLTGEQPDIIFHDSIGNVSFQDLRGVALDDAYFYLADYAANKVYIWEGIPDPYTNPRFTLAVNQPWRLSSDGRYLAVTAIFAHQIALYPIAELFYNAKPVATVGSPGRFNLPESALVSRGHLFVANTVFNRVFVWENIEDAIAGKDADVILGGDAISDRRPEIGKDNLFWPGALAFDGAFLWIGEFKFSERLLRLSVR